MIFRYIASFHDALRLVKRLTFSRIGNYLALRLGYMLSRCFRKTWVWSGPFSLHLETAAVCNLKCPECAAGRGQTRRHQKFMPPQLLNALLKLHQKHAFYCNLYFQGEPFLHPRIFSLIQAATQQNYYTVISTNGHFLHKKNCYKILESGLSRLIISLDGTTKESYQQYRKAGDFEKVINGISQLTALKQEKKTSKPYVVIQFLVNKTNEHQTKEMIDLARKLGADQLQFKSMQIDTAEGMEKFRPTQQAFNRYGSKAATEKQRETRQACFRLWSHAVYTSDGTMVPCCYDKIPQYGIAESSNGPVNLWKSPQMQEFRRKLWDQENRPAICSNCGS